jgi:hypothetical protein
MCVAIKKEQKNEAAIERETCGIGKNEADI